MRVITAKRRRGIGNKEELGGIFGWNQGSRRRRCTAWRRRASSIATAAPARGESARGITAGAVASVLLANEAPLFELLPWFYCAGEAMYALRSAITTSLSSSAGEASNELSHSSIGYYRSSRNLPIIFSTFHFPSLCPSLVVLDWTPCGRFFPPRPL